MPFLRRARQHSTPTPARFGDCLAFEEVVIALHAAVFDIAGAEGIILVARDGDEVVCVAEDPLSPIHIGARFLLPRCLSGKAMLSGKPIVTADVVEDKSVPFNAYIGTYMRTMATIPLGIDGPRMAMTAFWTTVCTVDAVALERLMALGNEAAGAFARIGYEVPRAPRLVA